MEGGKGGGKGRAEWWAMARGMWGAIVVIWAFGDVPSGCAVGVSGPGRYL